MESRESNLSLKKRIKSFTLELITSLYSLIKSHPLHLEFNPPDQNRIYHTFVNLLL